MAQIKSFSSVESFSREVLGLDSYDSWLISLKNKMIASIVEARKEKEISQTDLAKLLGTTQSVISRLEGGTCRHLTVDYLMKVLAVLGVSSSIHIKKTG